MSRVPVCMSSNWHRDGRGCGKCLTGVSSGSVEALVGAANYMASFQRQRGAWPQGGFQGSLSCDAEDQRPVQLSCGSGRASPSAPRDVSVSE